MLIQVIQFALLNTAPTFLFIIRLYSKMQQKLTSPEVIFLALLGVLGTELIPSLSI